MPTTTAKPRVRKAAAKKPTVKKAVTKKEPSKKAVAPAKKQSPLKGKSLEWLPKDKYGFAIGSNFSKIAPIVVAGGESKREVNDACKKVIGGKTAGGLERNVPVVVDHVVKRLLDNGYTIKSSWKMVAPPRQARKK